MPVCTHTNTPVDTVQSGGGGGGNSGSGSGVGGGLAVKMASDNEASCVTDPNFAVICSFLEYFGKSCGLDYPDIGRLQEMIENAQEVPQKLIDLHIKLLRKARKSVNSDRWEKALVKFCHTYSNQDGWELERFGYKKARVAVKLRLLKALLEVQFDMNQKFKNEINKLSSSELRLEPLGRDKSGMVYWCQLDDECNIRVYREDLDEENWELIAKTRDEVVSLINNLTDGEIGAIPISEDSNSLETSEKPTIDTGQDENSIVNGDALESEKLEQIEGETLKNNVTAELPADQDNDEEEEEEEEDDDEEDEEEEKEEEDEEEEENEEEEEEKEDEEDEKEEEEQEAETETVKENPMEASAKQEPELVQDSPQTSEIKNELKTEVPYQVTITKVEAPRSLEPLPKKEDKETDRKNIYINTKNGVAMESVVVGPKAIETPVITSSPLKLVNISELKQSPEKKPEVIGKIGMINNLPYTTTIEPSIGHNKLPIKPIDQLAATLSRKQSEKQHHLEKSSSKLDKIAENLAKGQVSMHSILNAGNGSQDEDLRLRNNHQRGIDLSTSPRGWEMAGVGVSDLSASNIRPVDFTGMDLSSRRSNKELPSPSTGYRPQDYHLQQQQREMDLSTRKSSVKLHPNMATFDPSVYDPRAIMMQNHAMVADLSKRQMPYSAYELPTNPGVPYLPPRHSKNIDTIPQQQRLPSYAMLPDPSKLTLRKRQLEAESLQVADMHKRSRLDIVPGLTNTLNPIKLQAPQQRMDWGRGEIVGEEITEPVMMVHGQGSGNDCDAANLMVEEAIEEPVMFVYGEGSGSECETGNPADETSTGKDDDSNKETEVCSSEVKTPSKPKFKLGVQVFETTSTTASPAKRSSRWDVGGPATEIADIPVPETNEAEKSDTTTSPPKFFFGPNCVSYNALKPKNVQQQLVSNTNDADSLEEKEEIKEMHEKMVPKHVEEEGKSSDSDDVQEQKKCDVNVEQSEHKEENVVKELTKASIPLETENVKEAETKMEVDVTFVNDGKVEKLIKATEEDDAQNELKNEALIDVPSSSDVAHEESSSVDSSTDKLEKKKELREENNVQSSEKSVQYAKISTPSNIENVENPGKESEEQVTNTTDEIFQVEEPSTTEDQADCKPSGDFSVPTVQEEPSSSEKIDDLDELKEFTEVSESSRDSPVGDLEDELGKTLAAINELEEPSSSQLLKISNSSEVSQSKETPKDYVETGITKPDSSEEKNHDLEATLASMDDGAIKSFDDFNKEISDSSVSAEGCCKSSKPQRIIDDDSSNLFDEDVFETKEQIDSISNLLTSLEKDEDIAPHLHKESDVQQSSLVSTLGGHISKIESKTKTGDSRSSTPETVHSVSEDFSFQQPSSSVEKNQNESTQNMEENFCDASDAEKNVESMDTKEATSNDTIENLASEPNMESKFSCHPFLRPDDEVSASDKAAECTSTKIDDPDITSELDKTDYELEDTLKMAESFSDFNTSRLCEPSRFFMFNKHDETIQSEKMEESVIEDSSLDQQPLVNTVTKQCDETDFIFPRPAVSQNFSQIPKESRDVGNDVPSSSEKKLTPEPVKAEPSNIDLEKIEDEPDSTESKIETDILDDKRMDDNLSEVSSLIVECSSIQEDDDISLTDPNDSIQADDQSCDSNKDEDLEPPQDISMDENLPSDDGKIDETFQELSKVAVSEIENIDNSVIERLDEDAAGNDSLKEDKVCSLDEESKISKEKVMDEISEDEPAVSSTKLETAEIFSNAPVVQQDIAKTPEKSTIMDEERKEENEEAVTASDNKKQESDKAIESGYKSLVANYDDSDSNELETNIFESKNTECIVTLKADVKNDIEAKLAVDTFSKTDAAEVETPIVPTQSKVNKDEAQSASIAEDIPEEEVEQKVESLNTPGEDDKLTDDETDSPVETNTDVAENTDKDGVLAIEPVCVESVSEMYSDVVPEKVEAEKFPITIEVKEPSVNLETDSDVVLENVEAVKFSIATEEELGANLETVNDLVEKNIEAVKSPILIKEKEPSADFEMDNDAVQENIEAAGLPIAIEEKELGIDLDENSDVIHEKVEAVKLPTAMEEKEDSADLEKDNDPLPENAEAVKSPIIVEEKGDSVDLDEDSDAVQENVEAVKSPIVAAEKEPSIDSEVDSDTLQDNVKAVKLPIAIEVNEPNVDSDEDRDVVQEKIETVKTPTVADDKEHSIDSEVDSDELQKNVETVKLPAASEDKESNVDSDENRDGVQEKVETIESPIVADNKEHSIDSEVDSEGLRESIKAIKTPIVAEEKEHNVDSEEDSDGVQENAEALELTKEVEEKKHLDLETPKKVSLVNHEIETPGKLVNSSEIVTSNSLEPVNEKSNIERLEDFVVQQGSEKSNSPSKFNMKLDVDSPIVQISKKRREGDFSKDMLDNIYYESKQQFNEIIPNNKVISAYQMETTMPIHSTTMDDKFDNFKYNEKMVINEIKNEDRFSTEVPIDSGINRKDEIMDIESAFRKDSIKRLPSDDLEDIPPAKLKASKTDETIDKTLPEMSKVLPMETEVIPREALKEENKRLPVDKLTENISLTLPEVKEENLKIESQFSNEPSKNFPAVETEVKDKEHFQIGPQSSSEPSEDFAAYKPEVKEEDYLQTESQSSKEPNRDLAVIEPEVKEEEKFQTESQPIKEINKDSIVEKSEQMLGSKSELPPTLDSAEVAPEEYLGHAHLDEPPMTITCADQPKSHDEHVPVPLAVESKITEKPVSFLIKEQKDEEKEEEVDEPEDLTPEDSLIPSEPKDTEMQVPEEPKDAPVDELIQSPTVAEPTKPIEPTSSEKQETFEFTPEQPEVKAVAIQPQTVEPMALPQTSEIQPMAVQEHPMEPVLGKVVDSQPKEETMQTSETLPPSTPLLEQLAVFREERMQTSELPAEQYLGTEKFPVDRQMLQALVEKPQEVEVIVSPSEHVSLAEQQPQSTFEQKIDEQMDSDDSAGCDNDESMFNAPPAEEDESAEEVLPSSVGQIRVKTVSELVGVDGGWKLDSTTESPPPPLPPTAALSEESRLTRQSRKRRNSAQDSTSEDCAPTQVQTEEDEAGGKRLKLRAKRSPDIELRKSVEKNRKISASSEDDSKRVPTTLDEASQEEEEVLKEEAQKTTPSAVSRKIRGRPKGRKRSRKGGRPNKTPKKTSEPISGDNAGAEAADESNDVTTDEPLSKSEKLDAPADEVAGTPKSTDDKKKQRKKRNMLLGLEIPPEATDMGDLSETPVRASRRIAQLRIRKEAEDSKHREDEVQEAIRKHKKDKGGTHHEKPHIEFSEKKKRKKQQQQESEEDAAMMRDLEKEDAKSKKKKKRRKKKKLAAKFNHDHPWQSSSGSSTSDENEREEEDLEEEIESDGERLVFKSDHEFSPESDLEKDDDLAEPLRRARTAQKAEEAADTEAEDEYACQKCSKADHPEWILLCDSCDKGWHCSCLRPALMLIPEGDWYCPPCQHKSLVVKLQESLKTLDQITKKHENEILRKKRLAYVGISLDNVLQKSEDARSRDESSQDENEDDSSEPGSSSGSSSEETSSDESEPVYQLRERRCANTSYKFNEYDDMINAAIKDEVDAVRDYDRFQGAGNQGRGKDIATIVNAEKEEKAQSEVLKQLKDDDLDYKGEKSEKESDEDYKIEKDENVADEEEEEDDDGRAARAANRQKLLARKKHRKLNSLDISSEEDDPYSDEDFKGTSSDEEEEDQLSSSDDSDMGSRRRGKKGGSRAVRRSTRARMTRYDEDFIDDSEDSDKPKRKKSRASWRDDSESEESDNSWRQKKKSRRTSTSRKSVPKVKPAKKKKKRKRIITNESDDEDESIRFGDIPQETSESAEQPAEPAPVAVDLAPIAPELVSQQESSEVPSLSTNDPIKDIEMAMDESTPMEQAAPVPMQEIPVIQQPVADPTAMEYNDASFKAVDVRRKKKDGQPKQKKIRRKVIYGRIPDENETAQEETTLGRRTRGRKISYLDAMPSDSDEELKKALKKTEETEEEFVVHDNEEVIDDVEKDSDSGDVYSPKHQSLRAKNKSPKMRRGKKSPGVKRKSVSEDAQPKPRKKPGPKPGTKHKPRASKAGEDLPGIDPSSLINDAEMLSSMQVDDPQGVISGTVTGEGSLAGLGPPELEGLDEGEFEQMMMEDEEYGRRQLEMAAIEIAKNKKKKEEREAKKLEKARLKALEILAAERQESMNMEGTDGEVPKKKKRGRRSKAEILAEQMRRESLGLPPEPVSMPVTIGAPLLPLPTSDVVAAAMPTMPTMPAMPIMPSMDAASDQRMMDNPMMPMIPGMESQQPLFHPDGSPLKPKRRGRGKGKKTLAMEAAKAAESMSKTGIIGIGPDANPEEMQPSIMPTPGSSTSGSAPSTPPAGVTSQGGPLPLGNQPTNPQAVYPGSLPPQQQSSVITRMLQSQPPVPSSPQSFTQAAAAMGHKYFGGPNTPGQMMVGPRPGYDMQSRGRIPSPYRQPGQQAMPPHFAAVRSGTPPGMRLRVPGPQMYHTPHHPMDPSPSGGGPISINSRTGDRSSPLGPGPPGPPSMIPPSAGSPLAKGGPTPPPPYVRGVTRFGDTGQMNTARHQLPPFTNASPTGVVVNHNMQPQPSPPTNRAGAAGNFSPYHPPPPPNYHYGAYPPPPPMSTADDAAAYQSSPYSSSAEQHYSSPGLDAQASGIQGPPPQAQPSSQAAPPPQQPPQSQGQSQGPSGPGPVGPPGHAHAHPGHPGHPEGHPHPHPHSHPHPGGKYDEEGSGEFGGLVSYFSSQREDDLES